MQTRRDALRHGLAAAGALGTGALFSAPAEAYTKAAFDAKSVTGAIQALGGNGSFSASSDVTIQGPEIAENGAVVPMTIASTLPDIRALALVIEKNPSPLIAVFHLNEFLEPSFATRAKMAETSQVFAVALANDGKAYFAKKEIKVTLGGCGG